MGNRYEEAQVDVRTLVGEIVAEFMPELINTRIKVLFDLKKRMSRGSLVISRLQKCSDLLRFLTKDEAGGGEGYDFILYLDKVTINAVDRDDKIRIIRHQLRHIEMDIENPENPYKMVHPDVRDFFIELELNKHDIRWAERVSEVAASLYEAKTEAEAKL
ncbi:MAG: hypothetical protein HQK88_01005 [Nitrospirae bacterium]|nr:hypothetical protein [Nitrospirota bacterium]MBF0535077.1 hypothetical protein [Nitrospirota bacterium]MBF0615373.1 hypothetical protein [Nitrospirota bacterium]